MSRTKRKDSSDTDPKRPEVVWNIGGPVVYDPNEKDPKRHWDKKKRGKPGRKAKEYLHKGRKAKLKAELLKDPDAMPAPKEPKSDVWDYN